MKLEPVFLLAPKPKPPSMPSRRAFLIAGGTFFAGIGLGGACGYAAGVSGKGEGVREENALPEPSGNAELDELRRLALKAPIEELVGKRDALLHFATSAYPNDKYIWHGIGRLVEATLQGNLIPNRRAFAAWLAQFIERGNPKMTESLVKHIPDLRRVR